VRIRTIDDQIARRQHGQQRIERGLGRLARRQHQPDDARRLQCGHHFLQGGAGVMARFRRDGLAHLMTAVVDCDPDAFTRQAPGHVAAHAAQSDDAEFHA
jgi:hypothetical protein